MKLCWNRGLALALVGLAGAAFTAPAEIDTDLMQALEDNNKDLASNLAQEDAKASAGNAAELHRLLQEVHAYYRGRGDAPDAVEIARDAVQIAQRIREQLAGKAFGDAAGSATELSRNCKSCHKIYKKDP